jgi:DNA replication protein DnaC
VRTPIGRRLSALTPCACRRPERLRRAALRARDAARLPPGLTSATFETFDVARQPVAHAAASSFVAALVVGAAPLALVLAGDPGTGKTHLASAIVNALLAHGRAPLYWVAPDLLDWLRAGYDDGDARARFEAARDADVLVLDDLGVEHATAWSDAVLLALVDRRLGDGLATVITTNCAPADLPPRLASRLRDRARCRVVTLAEGDYRLARRRGAWGRA